MRKPRGSASPALTLGAGDGLEGLFAYLPDVYVFAKDAEGRFIRCNQGFAQLAGARTVAEVLGRTDWDFFPAHLSETYVADDQRVMQSAEPIVDRLELVRRPDGTIAWHNTTKIPLQDPSGRIIGLAGFTRDIKKMSLATERFLSLAPVIERIMDDFAQPLTVVELARQVNLSVSQFERQFKRWFQVTPRRYITQVRLNAACQLLGETDAPVAEIAARTGFWDQSHFTHQFVRQKGISPRRYREQYRARRPVPGSTTATPGGPR